MHVRPTGLFVLELQEQFAGVPVLSAAVQLAVGKERRRCTDSGHAPGRGWPSPEFSGLPSRPHA